MTLHDSRILVTGAAGFIGFHLCQSLLKDGFIVYGVDNINSYYDPALKQARLDELQSHQNFSFNKLDISNSDELNKAFEDFKIADNLIHRRLLGTFLPSEVAPRH